MLLNEKVCRLKKLAAIWAVSGVCCLLLFAVYRLSQPMLEAMQMPLSPLQWTLMLANVLFMAYSEGYKGFQKGFSPRFAARVYYMTQSGRPIEMFLAPFFCFGYFGTSKKRQIVAIVLTIAIMVLALITRLLPQPWRGIVDAGVVVGLLWGTLSILVFVYYAFTDKHYAHSPELP